MRSALSLGLSRIDGSCVTLDETPGIGAPEDVFGVAASVAAPVAVL